MNDLSAGAFLVAAMIWAALCVLSIVRFTWFDGLWVRFAVPAMLGLLVLYSVSGYLRLTEGG